MIRSSSSDTALRMSILFPSTTTGTSTSLSLASNPCSHAKRQAPRFAKRGYCIRVKARRVLAALSESLRSVRDLLCLPRRQCRPQRRCSGPTSSSLSNTRTLEWQRCTTGNSCPELSTCDLASHVERFNVYVARKDQLFRICASSTRCESQIPPRAHTAVCAYRAGLSVGWTLHFQFATTA